MRILIILLAVALFIWSMRMLFAPPPQAGTHSRRRGSRRLETMVACRHCQLHVPVSEAIEDGDEFFCSQQHRLEWQQKQH